MLLDFISLSAELRTRQTLEAILSYVTGRYKFVFVVEISVVLGWQLAVKTVYDISRLFGTREFKLTVSNSQGEDSYSTWLTGRNIQWEPDDFVVKVHPGLSVLTSTVHIKKGNQSNPSRGDLPH